MNHLLRLKSWTKAKIKRLTATTSKTAIAVLSAAIIFLVISVSFSTSVRFFCWSHPGILLVVIAVLGEVICDWNRKKSLKERLKKFFGFLLVAGLLLEIREAVESDEEAASSIRLAGQANEHASANELAAKQLEIRLNDTKTELANAEANLVELQVENLPMDIGEQVSFANALRVLPKMNVELRWLSDPKSHQTAEDLAAVFRIAGWQVINQFEIQDIGEDGVVIGYNANGLTQSFLSSPNFPIIEDKAKMNDSKRAAHFLLMLLTNRGVPSKLLSIDRVRGVPTNAIIVAVCQRPNRAMATLMEWQAKDVDLQDKIIELSKQCDSIISAHGLPPTNLSEYEHDEVVKLSAEENRLIDEQIERSRQEGGLYDQAYPTPTNFNPTIIQMNNVHFSPSPLQ